eukprot:5325472-Prymnesium_polylepis.3
MNQVTAALTRVAAISIHNTSKHCAVDSSPSQQPEALLQGVKGVSRFEDGDHVSQLERLLRIQEHAAVFAVCPERKKCVFKYSTSSSLSSNWDRKSVASTYAESRSSLESVSLYMDVSPKGSWKEGGKRRGYACCLRTLGSISTTAVAEAKKKRPGSLKYRLWCKCALRNKQRSSRRSARCRLISARVRDARPVLSTAPPAVH